MLMCLMLLCQLGRDSHPLVSDFVFGFSLNSRAARVPLIGCQDDRESSLRVPSIT